MKSINRPAATLRRGRWRAALAAAAIVSLVGACGSTSDTDPEPSTGDEGSTNVPADDADDAASDSGPSSDVEAAAIENLRVTQAQPLASFAPNLSSNLYLARIGQEVNESLTRVVGSGEQLETVPALATEWELIEPTVWQFTLRPDVTFTDGTLFTAADVVASIDFIVDKTESPSYYTTLFEKYEVAAVDDLTVNVVTPEPNSAVVPSAFSLLRIFSEDQVNSESEHDIGLAPIGTGPYQVESFAPGTSVELIANPDWWGGDIAVQRVSITFTEDGGTRFSQLRAGDVEIAAELNPQQVAQIDNIDGVHAVIAAPVSRAMLVFNTYDGPGADVELRKAINYAVDRDAISAAVAAGPPIYGIFVPGEEGFDPDYQPFPYDPDMARQILEDAGLDGATLPIAVRTDQPDDAVVAELIQAQLADVGINLAINLSPASDWRPKYLDGTLPGAAVLSFNSAYPPSPDFLLSLHLVDNGTYSQAYGSAEVTRLANELNTTLDPDERYELTREIDKVSMEDEALWVPLYQSTTSYGVVDSIDWVPPIGLNFSFADIGK